MTPAQPVNEARDEQSLEELFQALAKLHSAVEFRAFLDDLCTPAELRSMAERWRVAKLLGRGLSYRAINEQTGVSTATITRVARSMTYGAKGYQLLMERIEERDQ